MWSSIPAASFHAATRELIFGRSGQVSGPGGVRSSGRPPPSSPSSPSSPPPPASPHRPNICAPESPPPPGGRSLAGGADRRRPDHAGLTLLGRGKAEDADATPVRPVDQRLHP